MQYFVNGKITTKEFAREHLLELATNEEGMDPREVLAIWDRAHGDDVADVDLAREEIFDISSLTLELFPEEG